MNNFNELNEVLSKLMNKANEFDLDVSLQVTTDGFKGLFMLDPTGIEISNDYISFGGCGVEIYADMPVAVSEVEDGLMWNVKGVTYEVDIS